MGAWGSIALLREEASSVIERSNVQAQAKANWPPIHLPRAWLISWIGTEPWAAEGDWRSVMGILSGRHSQKFIEDILWVLDVRAQCSGYNMAYYANRRRKFGLPYRFSAGIRGEGSNAFLYARRVANLRVTRDRTQETIQWTEPDDWSVDPHTHQPFLRQPGYPQSVTRSIDEHIGGEPYHRWDYRWT